MKCLKKTRSCLNKYILHVLFNYVLLIANYTTIFIAFRIDLMIISFIFVKYFRSQINENKIKGNFLMLKFINFYLKYKVLRWKYNDD